MKENRPSLTAIAIAILRAAESERSEDERIFYDPFAVHFVPSIVSKRPYFENIGRNSGYIVARARYIDDYLTRCINDGGIDQLVILGAGYDTRAYRFEELKDGCKVFEVDHPATQMRKKKKIEKIFGSLPDHVVYVSMDFKREELDEKLPEYGYDKKLQTLFIWEGVTYYLSEEDVNKTLSFIASNSGIGSCVVFDYLLASVIDGTFKTERAEKFKDRLAKIDEPVTFGIEEETIDTFLSSRGFSYVNNVGPEFLKEAYFKRENKDRWISPFYNIVDATVNHKK